MRSRSMGTPRRRGGPTASLRGVRRAPLLLAVALLLLPLVSAAPVGGATLPRSPTPTATTVTATVTVQGQPTAPATSVASAISTTLNGPLPIIYTWQASGPAGTLATISTARLQLYVFGVALNSVEVDITNPQAAANGTVTMLADFTYAHYVIGGVYQMEATLLAAGGATAYTEWFYLRLTTPYDVNVATVVAGLLIIWEIYTIAELGSVRAVLRHREAAAPRPSPPKGE